MMKTRWIVSIAVGALLLGAMWLPAAHAEFYSDAWITTKAKMSLLTSDQVTGTAINVDTVEGRITLHGKVPTAAEKEQAAALARKIEGVQEVRNLLQVVPPSVEEKVSVADNALKERVEKALDNVDSQDGVVTLFGIVPTQAAKAAAEMEARKVNGVKNVRNDLQVVTKAAQDAVEVKDEELTRKVNEAIDNREALNDADVDVEVKNGVVRLTGTVPSESLRLVAAIAARSITGVRSVHDELRINPPQG